MNTPATPPTPSPLPATLDAVHDRLANLEIKASLCDDWIEALNAQVYRQQLMIDQLQREVARLSGRLDDQAPAPFRSLRDDLPPHY